MYRRVLNRVAKGWTISGNFPKIPESFQSFRNLLEIFQLFATLVLKPSLSDAVLSLLLRGLALVLLFCYVTCVSYPRHPTSDQGASGRALLCKTFPGVGADFAAVQGRLQAVFVVLSLSPLGAFALHQLSIKETFW